jgi:hypothetical protein
MAQVIARCPLTGHYLFMGIDVDAERLATLPESLGRKFCPFCACEHAWQKKDAKLVSRKPPARPGLQQAL